MEKVFIYIEMELLIQENGLKINSMDLELKNGSLNYFIYLIIIYL